MKITGVALAINYRVVLLAFLCLAIIMLPGSGEVYSLRLNSSRQTFHTPLSPAAAPLTSLAGNENDPALAYTPQLDRYLLVFSYLTPVPDFLFSIQAQFVAGDGSPLYSPLVLSDNDSSVRSHPRVAYNSTAGEFLVIWDRQYSDVDHDIYARRVSIEGSTIGDQITVDYTGNDDTLPDLAYNPDTGEYMVVWQRYVYGAPEIYAQRLDAAGSPIVGGGVYVASDSIDESKPAVSYNPITNEFLVVYQSQTYLGNFDILGQRVSAAGVLIDDPIEVSAATGNQTNPKLACDTNTGEFLVVWQDARIDGDIYGQRLNRAGELIGKNFAVADQGTRTRRDPQIAFQSNPADFMVTWWMDLAGEDFNVYRQRVRPDGSLPEAEMLVSGLSTSETYPAIAAGGEMSYLLIWQDSRDMVQRENIYGEIVRIKEICGGVFLPTADASVYQYDPSTPQGGASVLTVERGALPGVGQARAFLTFDLSGRLPEEVIIHSAELELTLSHPPVPSEFQLASASLPYNWVEATLTWDNQPVLGHAFETKTYQPIWSDSTRVALRVDVSTLVNLWATGVETPTSLALLPGDAQLDLNFFSRESAYPPRLIVRCSPAITELPKPDQAMNTRQLAGIARLAADSSVPLTIQLGESGAVRFAMFDILSPSDKTDSLSRALWFLQEYADALRLVDPLQDLQFVRRSPTDNDLFFRQRYAGIPVVGSEINIHLVDAHITGVSGSYLSDLTLNPTPHIPPERARQIAMMLGQPGASVVSDDQLRLLNRSLFMTAGAPTYLTWLVVLDQFGGNEMYIDASTGALRFQQPRSLNGFDLDIQTANNHEQTTTTCYHWWNTYDDDFWCDEDGCTNEADQEGLNAFNFIKIVYDYYKNYLGRDSYDNDGHEISMYLHVNMTQCGGACWLANCDRMEFGTGFAVLDVIGHEFTHAVTEKSSNLIYLNQSGALNESFSDIHGAFIDSGDWTIGEDIPGGPQRSLADPTLFGQPDRYSQYFFTTGDNGGVHTNSGIHNKAAYLVTEGGSFNGVTIPYGGIGLYRARVLFYKTLLRLTSNASMLDARNAALATAMEMAQQKDHGFTQSMICIVRNSYHAVELGVGDLDCDGIEDHLDDDRDNDQVPNNEDNCSLVSNPDQKDTDLDGFGDECDVNDDNDLFNDADDNCPLVASNDQWDTDQDGQGDVCDDNDDNDLLPDSVDNCPLIKNYDQKNNDNDARGDVCDEDDDNDGRLDTLDNCPLIHNPDQANSDNDPFGDACDLCPNHMGTDNGDPDQDGKGNSCDEDDDNDGYLDAADNCPQAYNPDQRDMDDDGLGWACDVDDADSLMGQIKVMTLQYYPGYPIRFPLPGCDLFGPGYLDPYYYQKINLVSNAGFHAQVVDSSGKVIQRTSLQQPNLFSQSLVYQPAPFAFQSLNSLPKQQRTASLFSLLNDGMRYYLELFPADDVDLNQTYSLTIEVIEFITRKVFFPLTLH